MPGVESLAPEQLPHLHLFGTGAGVGAVEGASLQHVGRPAAQQVFQQAAKVGTVSMSGCDCRRAAERPPVATTAADKSVGTLVVPLFSKGLPSVSLLLQDK